MTNLELPKFKGASVRFNMMKEDCVDIYFHKYDLDFFVSLTDRTISMYTGATERRVGEMEEVLEKIRDVTAWLANLPAEESRGGGKRGFGD